MNRISKIIMDTKRKHRNKVDPGDTKWFTSQDLAARWKCHPLTIRRWTRTGKLRSHALSAGIIRYASADVLAFEEEALGRC